MEITTEMIATAERSGACGAALRWLREDPRTIAELVGEHPEFAGGALGIPGFADLLTDAQFGECARQVPGYAIQFSGPRLTDEQFAACVDAAPHAALAHACSRLTDEQFASCVAMAPATALRVVSDRMTDEQLAACISANPAYALVYAKHRLSPEQLKYCEGYTWSSRPK